MDIVTETLYSPNRMDHFRKPHVKCVTSVAIVSLLLSGMIVQPLSAQEDAEKYEIKIISGANLVNSVKRRVATEPIVEVQDRNKKPVGGVILTFTLPQTGPGGTFTATGSNIATVTTDASGRATMPPFQSNDQAGSYNVNVSGSVNGVTFSTVIPVTTAAASSSFVHSTAFKVTIFVAAATAIAAGVAVGRGGSSKTTVTPGTPSIGPAGNGPRR
jgi:hypothetical protein